jgi:hypothetical protein
VEACVNSAGFKRQVVGEGKKGDNSPSFHVVGFVSNTDYKLESTGNEGTYNLDSSFVVVDPSCDKDLKKGILDVTDSFDSFRKMTDFYFPLDFEDSLGQTLTFFGFYDHDEQVARTFLCCCSDPQSSHQAYF